MAGGSRNDDDGMVSGINVTPLVDVTLVLLIIFMVTRAHHRLAGHAHGFAQGRQR
ncbi:MAG: biopolymer transporter ExbD [Pseudomonadota bacterium]